MEPSEETATTFLEEGYRELTRRGFEYVLILDGDGQHLPEEIPQFLAEANAHRGHIIVGNRMVCGYQLVEKRGLAPSGSSKLPTRSRATRSCRFSVVGQPGSPTWLGKKRSNV